MIVTATEFKSNLGKYLDLVANEEIIITRNGKRIAKLTDANGDKIDIVRSLKGILPSGVTAAEARKERLDRHERLD
jgi:prevent-host-death family protein